MWKRYTWGSCTFSTIAFYTSSVSSFSDYIKNLEFFVNGNKGRVSYTEAYNMDNRLYHTLLSNLRKKLSTEEGQKNAAADELENQIEEGVGR